MTFSDYTDSCDAIVVNYNAGSLLINCVSSILDQGIRRVIVVDNNSSDGSIKQLLNIIGKERVKLILNPTNLGFAAACNLGVLASDADRLLFLNPDSMLTSGALSRMLKVLDSDQSIGMVGGLLSNPDGSEQAGGRRVFPTPKRAFMRAFGLSRLSKKFPSIFSDFLLHKEPLPAAPVPVEAISGACMLVKREAINDVGMWDAEYFLHCEDLDWCMRFRLKGWQVVFVPDARIVHIRGACSRGRPFFVEWHKHRGMLRFYQKHFRQRYPGLLWGVIVVGVWMRFLLVSTYYWLRLGLVKMGLLHD